MKRTGAMKPTGTLFACLALATLAADEAGASDYTRSCRARWSVGPTSFRGQSWSFEFEGRGTVGYYNPNEARRRARGNIDECLTTHWANRYAARPNQCTQSNGIHSYAVGCLSQAIIQNICRLNPGHQTITVMATASYSGDTGCIEHNNWMSTIARDYVVTCPGLEFEQNVDRPGMNLRNFNLDRAEYGLCQTACANDSRCQAWTYVRPGVQGTGARCWLKSGVPAPVVSSCCTSGVPTRLH
jgi:hypothetical protein